MNSRFLVSKIAIIVPQCTRSFVCMLTNKHRGDVCIPSRFLGHYIATEPTTAYLYSVLSVVSQSLSISTGFHVISFKKPQMCWMTKRGKLQRYITATCLGGLAWQVERLSFPPPSIISIPHLPSSAHLHLPLFITHHSGISYS